MAVVQHTMMAHLGTGVSPALAAPGGGGSAGGGRVSKGPQRPWRSQFNQFKIEPLLVRNAPSVEVSEARARTHTHTHTRTHTDTQTGNIVSILSLHTLIILFLSTKVLT